MVNSSPGICRKKLTEIAALWGADLVSAAKAMQPAGAIYYNMDEQDVRRVLSYPATMIGSDGLPNDPMPHPRLWGAFPRVLGYYCREKMIFPLTTAIHKMTGLSASRFRLSNRGYIRKGYYADLVLLNPDTVIDVASFTKPQQPAEGIELVLVNGKKSYGKDKKISGRAGRFLRRNNK